MKVALAAALCLLLGAAPVAGKPPAGEMVLRGDSSASVEVRLAQPADVFCCRMVFEEVDGRSYFRIAGFEVETEGTFAGFAIERPSDGRILRGAVRLPAMDLDDGIVPGFASFGRTRRLPAGRYRIHLLTDGPSTVRFTVPGLRRDVHLRPEGASDVTASLVELTPEDVQERVPVEVPGDALVVLVSKTEGDFTQGHYLSHCLAAPGAPCTSSEDYEVWTSPGSGGGGGTRVDSLYDPPTGSLDAVFTSRSLGVPAGTYGFVLVLG